ncbi:MAG: outer membrane protein [Gemmatimonadaceae bacterium]
MKGITRVGAVALVLVAGASIAGAQGVVPSSPPVAFGVVGGATLPSGDLSDGAKTGWHAGGAVQFSVPMIPLGLKADVVYHRLGLDDSISDIEGTTFTFTGKLSMITGTLNGMFLVPMVPGGMGKPYLIAGVGAYNLRTSAECTGDCMGFTGTISDNTTKFGLNGGAGVQFGLAGLSTFVEARYHHIFTDKNSDGSCRAPPSSR